MANALGEKEAEKLLQANLEQEKATLEKMTAINTKLAGSAAAGKA